MTSPRLILGATLAILLIAIGLIVYGQTRPLERTFHGQLEALLPPAPPGWTRTARPIADTPEMKQKVDELLNYDDGAFYDYTSGNLRLSVYAAYWAPGKMSSRLVAVHTPDVCWVGAGWKCTARSEINPLVSSPSSETLATEDLKSQPFPTESRTFNINGTTEYVWFWHLVNGIPQSYGTGQEPPWYAGFTDMLHHGMNQRTEQFFIRLSSPQALDDPALAPVLRPVLTALPLTSR